MTNINKNTITVGGDQMKDVNDILNEIANEVKGTQVPQQNNDIIREVPRDADFQPLLQRMQNGEALTFSRSGHTDFKYVLRKAGYKSPSEPTTRTDDGKWLTSQWTGDGLPTVNIQHRVFLYKNSVGRDNYGTRATVATW